MVQTTIVKVEGIYLVQSTIKDTQTHLKKLEQIYDKLNLVEYKKLRKNRIYYEVWFMFMDEIIHLQKILIDYMMDETKQNKQEILKKIKLLMKPISISFFKFKTPSCIRLYVPEQIFKWF
jgi:hypothetical protein